MTDLSSSGSDGGGRSTRIEKPTRVELRQAHIHVRNTLSWLEKAMSEDGVTRRALKIEENVLGTDYWFSDRTHALDLVQFIEGVVPVKKQSDDDGVSATFFSLHILPICQDDLIPGSVVGVGDNFVICTGVTAHGISLMGTFTPQTAFLTAEAYWRAPCAVLMFGCELMAEYLVLDMVTHMHTTTDPPDSYCLADAHIVRVSDLGKKTDDHKKLLVWTHLGRLLKPGDYAIGYDVAGAVILVKKKIVAEPSFQEPRSVDAVLDGIMKMLSRELEISKETPLDDVLGDGAAADNTTMGQIYLWNMNLNMQKNFNRRLVYLHQLEHLLLGPLPTRSDPQAHQGAILVLKLAQRQLTQLLSSFLQWEMDQSFQGYTPRRSARLKAKPTESPEGEKPTKRRRKSSGKKGKADKKDAKDGENVAVKAAEDAAAAAGAQESTDVEMKDAEGNADKAGKVHAEGNADKAEGEEVPKTTAEGGKEAEEGKEEKEVSTTLEGKEDENADKKMEDSLMLIPTSEAKENANADKEKLEDSEALAQAQLIEKESESADKKTHQGIRHLM